MEIIPAIDILDGRCVRLTQGDYGRRSVYYDDPADAARRYADAGFRRIHVVDLDGAKASRPQNLAAVERIALRTGLDIQFGGGVKSEVSLREVFAAGARRAICGSAAAAEPELFGGWIDLFGPERMILGADVRDGRIATHGWLRESETTAEELIRLFPRLTQAVCTDISCDGMLSGPSFGLYRRLQDEFPGVDITVSGGVSSLDDIRELIRMGLRSVIVGKAIYENRVTLEELAALGSE